MPKKEQEMVTLVQHKKELAKKDAIITELANALDELRLVVDEYQKDTQQQLNVATKLINSNRVKQVAWPPRVIKKRSVG
jgi:hypothetical protein